MRHDTTRSGLIRRLPLLIIACTALVGVVFLRDDLSFEALGRHAAALTALRDGHPVLMAVGFMLAYAVMVALSLPGATLATLAGGMLFGVFPGVLFNVTGASLGAVGVFLAARAGMGADVAARLAAGGGGAARLLERLQRNEWPALLVMRLLPVVPFFAANLLPAFAGVRLWPFAATTVLGILPGALILTTLGSGLAEVLAQGGVPDLSVLTSPQVVLGLSGLATLVVLPMLWRALRPRREGMR